MRGSHRSSWRAVAGSFVAGALTLVACGGNGPPVDRTACANEDDCRLDGFPAGTQCLGGYCIAPGLDAGPAPSDAAPDAVVPEPDAGAPSCGPLPPNVGVVDLFTLPRGGSGPHTGTIDPGSTLALQFQIDPATYPRGFQIDLSPQDVSGEGTGPYTAVVSACPGSSTETGPSCSAMGIESTSILVTNQYREMGLEIGCAYVPGQTLYLNLSPTSSTPAQLVVYVRPG